MAGSSEAPEIIAEIQTAARSRALETVRAWLDEHAPGDCAVLTLVNGIESTAQLIPTIWVLDVTELKHVPAHEYGLDTAEFRALDFDLENLDVTHHIIVGPLPPNPLDA